MRPLRGSVGDPMCKLKNGRPVIETPKQDDATLPFVDLVLVGCTNLLYGSDYWTLPIIYSTNDFGKPANRDWFEPLGTPSNAFFKLKATLRQ